MAYLMRQCGMGVGEALNLLREKKEIFNPNDGFRAQLKVGQECGYELWRLEWVSTRMRMKGDYKEMLGVLLEVERSERRLKKLGGEGESGKVDVTLRENEPVKASTGMERTNVSPKLRS